MWKVLWKPPGWWYAYGEKSDQDNSQRHCLVDRGLSVRGRPSGVDIPCLFALLLLRIRLSPLTHVSADVLCLLDGLRSWRFRFVTVADKTVALRRSARRSYGAHDGMGDTAGLRV